MRRSSRRIDSAMVARRAGALSRRIGESEKVKRSPSKQFALLAFLFASGWGGSGCTLVPKVIVSEKRDVYTYNHTFELESGALRRSPEALGNRRGGGNSVTILKNGNKIFPAITRDIRAAEHT